MLQLERQKLILEYLKQNRKATTNELSEMLGVSTTTIRTDLNQMDKEKLLTKHMEAHSTTITLQTIKNLPEKPISFMNVHWKIKKKKRQLLQMPSTW